MFQFHGGGDVPRKVCWRFRVSVAMPRRRDKFGRLVKVKVAPKPVPFTLSCPCGNTVEGVRSEQHQRAICPRCGEAFYVLPRNVYPPAEPRRKKKPPSAAAQQWLTSTALAVQTASRSALQRTQRRLVATKQAISAWVRSLLTPMRVVLLLAGIIVAATGWWVHRSHRLEQASIVLKEATEEGEQALRSGDLFAAWKAFDQAAEAAELLGLDDRQARRIRQLARETAAANNLCPKPLVELIEEADDVCRRRGSEAWKSVMSKYYRGTWIILQTQVRGRPSQPSPEQSPLLQLACPLLVGGRPVRFDGVLPVLKLLDASVSGRSEQGQAATPKISSGRAWEVILAAQLEDCRKEDGPPEEWVIRCNPLSAFLWTDYTTLRLAGFATDTPADEQRAKQILARQELLVLGQSRSTER